MGHTVAPVSSVSVLGDQFQDYNKGSTFEKEIPSHLESVDVLTCLRSPWYQCHTFVGDKLLCQTPTFYLGSVLGLMGRAIPPDRHSPHNLKEQHHMRGSITQGKACVQKMAMALRDQVGK